ncbi:MULTISPECIES: NAD(P)H-dependent oxidoreductase [unclassified Micromonospora]|uniref:FMN-dependent NADH-azoreductase n=1 Tax=unclassified Micromonospora TaxID=2617518 RepID=UPI001C24190B|nr:MULTISPECIES: NAD(P)H-dependent oxidoreductase [unclassified Micromonospora]MBU8858686.1 NAD(P)H-dependent oxidoreductase [Micromonospora sp. WMMB482]MDM4784330.1 NAD(P)H-dependent oxidoreductase [Micromonospora sp. b486]
MAHLLHIDSSITGERSISRRLTARAAAAWRAAHPDGTVTYRDLGQNPLPHLNTASGLARMVPPDQHTPEQQASWRLTEEVVAEVTRADTVLLGLPLYNYGPPSSVKSWVDHLIAPGIAYDPATNAGLLGDRQFVVLVSRGGGYGPGTPREGWDHAEPWLPHGLSLTGLEPRFICTELTLAPVNPAMAELIPLFEQSLAAAERAVDELWVSASAAA